jgi:predicted transcriptional regulator
MSKVILHSGEDVAAAAERFITAWEKAEQGEAPAAPKTHIVFESWSGLASVLTPKRVDLLRYLHRHPGSDIRRLAGDLGCDIEQAERDVDELTAAGLIDRLNDGLHADYAEIRTAIAM